jgi:hypothetical protein
VVAAFDGGTVSSDAGALLLGRTDEAIGFVALHVNLDKTPEPRRETFTA